VTSRLGTGKIITFFYSVCSSSFWLPRKVSYHMDRQARTGDSVLVKSREMTGRSQSLPGWLGKGEVKTTENKTHWPRWAIEHT